METKKRASSYKLYEPGQTPRRTKYNRLQKKREKTGLDKEIEEEQIKDNIEKETLDDYEFLEQLEPDQSELNLIQQMEYNENGEQLIEDLLTYAEREIASISTKEKDEEEQQEAIFPNLKEFVESQSLPKIAHVSRNEINIIHSSLYSGIKIIYLFYFIGSKLSNIEAQILFSRMVLEHKLDNTTKEHLFDLINCFLPTGLIKSYYFN